MIIVRKFRRVSLYWRNQNNTNETCWRHLERPIKTEHVGEVLVSHPREVVLFCVCVLILNLFRSLDPLKKKKAQCCVFCCMILKNKPKNQGLRFVCMNGFTDIPRLRWCQIVSDIVQYWCTARVARWEIKSGQQETIEGNSQQTVLSARCCKDILWMLYQRFKTIIAHIHATCPWSPWSPCFKANCTPHQMKSNETHFHFFAQFICSHQDAKMGWRTGHTLRVTHLPKPSPILSYLS